MAGEDRDRLDRDRHRPAAAAEPAARGHDEHDLVARRTRDIGDVTENAVVIVLDGQADEIAGADFLRKAGVEALLRRGVAGGRLLFTMDQGEAFSLPR